MLRALKCLFSFTRNYDDPLGEVEKPFSKTKEEIAFGNRKVKCFSINNRTASERHVDACKTTNTAEIRSDRILLKIYITF